MRTELPEPEPLFFNADVEERTMPVWPVIAGQVQAKTEAADADTLA